MPTWIFEPGHTEAEFRARHMMVTWVRGMFTDIHGRLELDWGRAPEATFHGEIDAAGIWTGEPAHDKHLRSADFLVSTATPGSPSSVASSSAPAPPSSRATLI
jgi:polyisoprenoid-binding protein YceI